MKIGSLAQDVVEAVYEHNGEKLTLSINRNIVTPAYLRQIGAQEQTLNGLNTNGARKKKKRSPVGNGNGHSSGFDEAAALIERQVKVYVPLLTSGLLQGWDLTEDDGETPAPLAEGLKRLSEEAPLLVVDLWTFAMETAQSVKKTTSSPIDAGSPAPVDQAPSPQESPTM